MLLVEVKTAATRGTQVQLVQYPVIFLMSRSKSTKIYDDVEKKKEHTVTQTECLERLTKEHTCTCSYTLCFLCFLLFCFLCFALILFLFLVLVCLVFVAFFCIWNCLFFSSLVVQFFALFFIFVLFLFSFGDN